MFCSQCGTYNDMTASACVRCGTSLDSGDDMGYIADAPRAESVPEAEALPAQQTPEPKEELADERICEKAPAEIKEYILWAIISAILFSIAFGTAAVIFSGFTNTERKMGNLEKAERYSEKTRFFCVISTALAIVKAVAATIVLIYFATQGYFL